MRMTEKNETPARRMSSFFLAIIIVILILSVSALFYAIDAFNRSQNPINAGYFMLIVNKCSIIVYNNWLIIFQWATSKSILKQTLSQYNHPFRKVYLSANENLEQLTIKFKQAQQSMDVFEVVKQKRFPIDDRPDFYFDRSLPG